MYHCVLSRLFAIVFVSCACIPIQPAMADADSASAAPNSADPNIVDSTIAAAPAGQVRFYNIANSDFDIYSKRPDELSKEWMRANYFRMQTYSPYFDSRLAWFPNAWAYKDSYAIKRHWPEFRDHPEWVLRDADGRLLFIPWGCENGSCPQYAADVGNPAFRAHWIERARALIAKGYKGLWVDDVNLAWRVGNGDGDHVKPIDPRTGKPMTLDDWQRYFAEFMEEIRKALPDAEIAHNSIWYAGPPNDTFIQRQINAADYINLERGATDRGLRGGDGKFGLETFFGFVDFVQSQGRSVIMMDYGKTRPERVYGLAAWLLISGGRDLMSSSRLQWTAPDNFWPGYQLNLGEAAGPRYKWRGLLRRDFECGVVLLNQPDARRVHVTLPRGLTTLSGTAVSDVTLGPSRAAIYTRRCE
jgi:hypothetical protein